MRINIHAPFDTKTLKTYIKPYLASKHIRNTEILDLLQNLNLTLTTLLISLHYYQKIFKDKKCNHEYFISTLLIAYKYLNDKPIFNQYFADNASLSVELLNTAERSCLTILNYNVEVGYKEFKMLLWDFKMFFGGVKFVVEKENARCVFLAPFFSCFGPKYKRIKL